MFNEQCKKEFEAWANKKALELNGDFNAWTENYQYYHSHVDAMWKGFQAAYNAALPEHLDFLKDWDKGGHTEVHLVPCGNANPDNIKPTEQPVQEWEYFCDHSYYDQWAVREKGETRWGHCFHVPSLEEAKGLADVLNSRATEREIVKDDAYYKRVYEDCGDGPYHPFRDHKTQFGWGIRHRATGKTFGYIGAKGSCFGVAAALNGKWDAAKEFIEADAKIPDEYFSRFKSDDIEDGK